MSTIRRRGSSQTLEDAVNGVIGVRAHEAVKEDSSVFPASSSGVNPLRVVLAVGLMALSAFGGATGYNRAASVASFTDVRSGERRNLAEQIGKDMEGFRRGLAQADYAACIADVTKCPKYTMTGYNRLVEDWKVRYANPKCYLERLMPADGTCHTTCSTLFLDFLEGVEWGPYVTQACQVGCTFYEKYATLGPSQEVGIDCMWNCKNTVMNLEVNSAKCNWNQGLGIAVFNAEEGFGAHHACEMGCIIGGARPNSLIQRLSGVP